MNIKSNVASLNISCKSKKNCFGNTGAIVVSKFLCYNTNILKLDISHSDIYNDGVVAIGSGKGGAMGLQPHLI